MFPQWMKESALMFMAIYYKPTTRPRKERSAASACSGPRLWLLGAGMLRISLGIVIIGLTAGTGAFAQDDGSPRWLERASITRAKQPDWVTPLITASANLEEAGIYDVSRKIPTNGIPLVTAGSNRGIQFVPFGAFQITFAATPYQFHNDAHVKDGFGDTQFGFKYRVASSNIEHKDFAISIATGVSVPTGSYQNGQHSGTITPTVLGEKGWGPFDVQSTIGIQIPLSDTYLTGQQYTSNTAFQYRLSKRLWPELEVNAMGDKGGPSDGKKQTFLTPGLFVGRFPVNRNMGLTFGVGIQIATTSYHTYDHNLLFSVRIPLQSPGVR
jgi:Putative MetA-pathway of phenol degradation